MTVSINGTSGIVNDATDLNYTGTLTGGTGVVNLGSGQVYKDASGNVGIGTATPNVGGWGKAVTLQGVSNAAYEVTDGTVRSVLVAAGASVGLVGTETNHPFAFQTNGTERARIDSSGNLLINTTTQLNNSNSYLNILYDGGNFYGSTFKATSSAGTAIAFINSSGTSVGSITQNNTATSYITSSDYRLKEAIAPMTGALAKVALLKPCTYKWKVDGSDGQGFIAHELAEVEAGCVTGEKDAVDAEGNPQYQGIDTSFLVATLAAAIQELKAVVDEQAARITALEGTAA